MRRRAVLSPSFLAFTALLAFAFSESAGALPVTYTDSASFFADLPGAATTVDFDGAAVLVHDSSHDAQPQTGPSGRLGRIERIKNPLLKLGVDPNTGVIQWTPDNAHVGSIPVTVRAQDEGGLFDTQSFDVYVANVNDAPTITSSPVTACM